MSKAKKTKAVLGGRLARLREDYISYSLDGNGSEVKTYGLKQSEFARLLQDLMGEGYTVSVSLVSAWETGRRPVPEHFVDAITRIFGCTRDYLCGNSNERSGKGNEPKPEENKLNEIGADVLSAYDGEPLWVVFSTYEFADAWAIYNAAKRQLVFKDGVRRIKRMEDLKFYTQVPDYELNSMKGKRSLDTAQILACKKVFVLMDSPDRSVRARYNGWYNVDSKRDCLCDPWHGTVLPLSGVNVSYRAYSMGDRKKFIKDDRIYSE